MSLQLSATELMMIFQSNRENEQKFLKQEEEILWEGKFSLLKL